MASALYLRAWGWNTVYCPACGGELTFDEDNGEVTCCDHCLYVTSEGQFIYVSNLFMKIVQDLFGPCTEDDILFGGFNASLPRTFKKKTQEIIDAIEKVLKKVGTDIHNIGLETANDVTEVAYVFDDLSNIKDFSLD